jgi:hypothetical protein
MLLPLLMKEEILNKDVWAPNVEYSAAVGVALDSIVMELRQHRDDSHSAILDTMQAPISPNMKENRTFVPTLKFYGVSLEVRRVRQNLLCNLYVLNRKHTKSNILYCEIRNGFTSSFVHVPSLKGFVCMKENAQKQNGFPKR